MSWQDRVREAAYTSPGGTRQTFVYEDVLFDFDKKTVAFDFADADGTYIQDLGNTSRRYPLRVITWGADHDTEADSFIKLLEERGEGKLEHPFYGTIDVVPFGTIRRRDDLVTAANQTIIEVVFWQTLGVIYPTLQTDPKGQSIDLLNTFRITAPEQFEQVVDLDSAVETSSFKNIFERTLDNVNEVLGAVADTEKEIRDKFEEVRDSINNAIDTLVRDPLTLAFQFIELVRAPSLAILDIKARLEAYKNLLDIILGYGVAELFPGSDSRVSNAFHAHDLAASSYITSSVSSVLNTEFETKVDALEAADQLLSQFDSFVEWRDDNFEALGEIDTGETYQSVQSLVAVTAGALVEMSFSLKQENYIVLDRARTIIDLEAELYGTIDENLDFIISSNSLTGDEILELPRGKELVYYV